MQRVLLIHWHAEEAEERAERLRRAGYLVEPYSAQGGEGLRTLRQAPPDAVVVDLGRLPSHGRAVGMFLRQQKATRRVPLVFVDGEASIVARVRERLPDAVYTSWRGIRGSLRRAIQKPPTDPVIPGTMDDYSGTPLPKKLGIRQGIVVTLLGAPPRFERSLGRLPEDVTLRRQARGRAQLVILFARSVKDLDRRLPVAIRCLSEENSSLWIAWQKQASGTGTDLTQKVVRKTGMASGLVDYKICSIDAIWSGLRFAAKKARGRPGRRSR